MSAIGEKLRRERLQRKLGLEQISRELKISQRFLEAIEDDQFDKLPGGVFAKSFVRQYARLLGLDEEELAAEVQRVIEPPSAVPQFAEQPKTAPLDIRVPRIEPWQSGGESRSPLPALALVVVVMLVCSGVYAWWQRQRTMVSAQSAPPPTVQAPAPAPVAPPLAVPAPAVSQPESTPPPTVQPQSAATQPPARTAAERPAETPASAPAPRPAEPPKQPTRPANTNAAVRVAVTADETVWVLARADDKYLFSGTLEANQTRTVEANDKVLLRLGNAGGVSITLNGKPVGAVGPKGQVRTVQFTSGGFQIVAAPRPSLPLDDIF